MTFFLSHLSKGELNANPASVLVCAAKKTLLNVEFPLKKIIGNFLLIRHDFNSLLGQGSISGKVGCGKQEE